MSTTATREQSAAIRKRMQLIRNELPYAVDEVRDDLKQLGDWKYYVRKMPLTSVALTAAAAYMAVPAKSKAKPVRANSSDVQEEVAKPSFVGGLLGAAGAMALKAGTSMAIRKISGSLLPQNSSVRS